MENNNEVKRTPGKWLYEEHDPEISRFAGNIISELGKGENGIMNIRTIDIILNHNGKDEADANARFICKAVNNYDKLKEDNALLLEALKEIIDLFPMNPKLPISYQVLGIANEALSKTGNIFRKEDIELIKQGESK